MDYNKKNVTDIDVTGKKVLLSLLSLLQNQILFPEHILDLALQPF